MHNNLLAFAMSALAISSAGAASAAAPALTIYRGDSDALFQGGSTPLADGHAVVHEQRTLQFTGGKQTIVIDGLPAMIDSEAVMIDLGPSARVLAQRVVSAGDSGGALGAYRGAQIQVFGDGNQSIAEGTLVAIDGATLGVRDSDGHVGYVHDYTRVRFPQRDGLPGSTLQVAVDGKAGAASASLTYPTSGLGWRAAYAALLQDGPACTLRLDALASIANRSGRDYSGANLKLVAGAPNFARSGYAPRPMMMKSMDAAAPQAMPEQSALGDYRVYAIDGTLDLPDASVTQVPLYAHMQLPCERNWVFENGSGWTSPTPLFVPGPAQDSEGPVNSQLKFRATENLPAGTLRVLLRDHDGRVELLGESRMSDTVKGGDVEMSLGPAFALSAARARTEFKVDRATRTMEEGFRITLGNVGETVRTITVREHPNRWRVWTIASSSQKPTRQTPDTLEFRVAVPAHGKTILDYAVRYAWTGADE